MYSWTVFVSLFISAVYGSGEVTFIHHPKSVHFKGNEILDQSSLKEVFSASLGFTTSQDVNWPGLKVTDPFHYAEALVVLVVDGIEAVSGVKGRSFAVNTDEDEDVTWLNMERRVRNRFPSQNNTLMRVELSEGSNAIASFHHLFGEFEPPAVNYLDLNVSEDNAFVSEISLLGRILSKMETDSLSRDGVPDIYWFVLRGLHAVSDLHIDDSMVTEEAKQLLLDSVNKMNAVFTKAYEGNVLTVLLTTDVSHTRRVRQVPPEKPPSNVAPDYDENYPVVFNILLWFMVVFVMSLIAICVAIMNMDPGRDSIIYRMTTMKSMKKEN